MRRLTGIATMCGAAICGGGACTQPAAAERPLGRAMAQAARALVAIIRHDARRISRAGSNGALIASRHRGRRTIDVFFRARPTRAHPWHGAYELKLQIRHHHLAAVTISYFPTEGSWCYGSASQGEGPSYSFTISPPGSSRGWRFSALDSFFGCGAGPAPSSGCEGLSQAVGYGEREGNVREFRVLAGQAIAVAHRAPRHRPLARVNLFAARGSVGR